MNLGEYFKKDKFKLTHLSVGLAFGILLGSHLGKNWMEPADIRDWIRTVAAIGTAIIALLAYRLAWHRWSHDYKKELKEYIKSSVKSRLDMLGEKILSPTEIAQYFRKDASTSENREVIINAYIEKLTYLKLNSDAIGSRVGTLNLELKKESENKKC